MSQLMSTMVKKTLKENIKLSAYLGKHGMFFFFYLYTHIQIVFLVLKLIPEKKMGFNTEKKKPIKP